MMSPKRFFTCSGENSKTQSEYFVRITQIVRGTSETLQRIFKSHGVHILQNPLNSLRNQLDYEVSLFSWSVEQNARDTQMTTRVAEGARGCKCKRFSLVYIKTHKTAINRPVDHTEER